MSRGPDVDQAHVGALANRMLGGLLLCGAGALLGLVLLLLSLPRVGEPGQVLVLLPGMQGRHGISSAALPVLGAGSLLMGLPGLLALARARRAGVPISGHGQARSLWRPKVVLLVGIAVLAFVLLRR